MCGIRNGIDRRRINNVKSENSLGITSCEANIESSNWNRKTNNCNSQGIDEACSILDVKLKMQTTDAKLPQEIKNTFILRQNRVSSKGN